MNTKNKIAVITGGSRGLGKSMAISLAKKGIDIVLTYKSNKEAAEQVIDDIQSLGQKAAAFQLDTNNVKGFDNFFKHVTEHLQEQNGTSNSQQTDWEKAKEKLSITDLSVGEIAYELGFEHPQSFSKLFKTKTRLSPLEFRQSFN